MSNVMKLANAIVRENGIDTAKRSAAFDELRKLAEKMNAVPACIAVISNVCERAGMSRREIAPLVRAYAHTSYPAEGNNSISEMIVEQRAENTAKRKAIAKAAAAKLATKKATQSSTSTPAPRIGDGNGAAANGQAAPPTGNTPQHGNN